MKPSFVLISLLLALVAHAQPKAITRADNNLLGPAKTVNLIIYEAREKFGDLVKEHHRFSQVDEYNKAGLLVAIKETDRSVVTRYTFKYDKNNRLVEKKTISDSEEITEKLTYSAVGLLTEADTWVKDKLQTRLKNKYNDAGKVVVSNLYHGDGKLKESQTFEYNSDNQLVAKSTLDGTERIFQFVKYSYDDKGRVASEITADRGENSDAFEKANGVFFTYDEKGRIISRERMSHKGESNEETVLYDDFGNTTKEFTRADNFVTSEYTYDKQNNWITEIRRWDQGTTVRNYICERTISYY